MNHLHSLPYTNTLLYGSSLGLDYHNNLGLDHSDNNMSIIMDGSAASFSTQESDFSTGYLEDALVEFGESSKRRRLLPYTDTDDEQSKSSITTTTATATSIDDFDKNFWNLNPIWNQPVENFYCMDQIERICGFSDEHISPLRSRINEQQNILVEDTKTTQETISASESPNSSSSSYKESLPKTSKDTPLGSSSSSEEMMMRKKRVLRSTTRVVYPFALVKPGGEEDEVTLNDINERMLMAPTRPVRHPVGDFACRPCVSATGPGLSGKAVVALTRIHTQGRRGTITIIRTKD